MFDYNQIKYKLVFQLLLEAGLPAYPQNDDKNTPADLATSAGNKGIVSLLGQYHTYISLNHLNFTDYV